MPSAAELPESPLTEPMTEPVTNELMKDEGAAPERKLTARGRDRKRALLDYATKRFAENGFHPTSVSDIVDGIGVGKGVFYWYFPSKDDVLREILRQSLYDLRKAQQDAIGDATDPLGRIERGIRSSLRWYENNPDILRLTMFCWTEERFARALVKGRRISVADISKHVTAAMDEGLTEPGDPSMLATGILGVIDEVGRSYVLDGRPLDADVVDFAVRMCLHGVVGDRR